MVFCCALPPARSAPAPQDGEGLRFPFKSRGEPRFDEVDYGRIELRAKERGLDVPERELGPLVRRNFQYVFWRCLNQRRFLVAPAPRKVADSMLKVLELNRTLMARLDYARSVAADGLDASKESERRRVIREVGQAARDLKRAFRGTFIELERAEYQISVPSGGQGAGVFLSFLLQAEKIGRQVTRKLDSYFFAPAPGAVAVSDFEEASIGVLCEAIERLSELSEKTLRQ